ncbi:MAG: methanogenesis marker 7 protein [Candidatus Methanoliparum thermophilum]|uniref:Methanogenesis marker 7 protein n=1 Tax=Methanoliparum thermophilum TaxID=2491083 RepID=A0A520KU01_METT2|nr:methyl-coenzyme M reductase family protein [Candidatus Methanoliparum sp. LAM-1]RZN65557.1 MAG: methanogenesis marker 7 protein [Candidatus Methanoliparum thermophilum]BDC35345.1 methanogenesis marker 7 protein [Candidatus Methanoliparum sp. LAM-1]
MGYKGYLFKGGYKRQDLIEFIEDVGGTIINENIMGSDTTTTFVVPEKDSYIVIKIAKDLGGELEELPLIGSEIALVLPSLTRRHFPHPACDISEYLRKKGAKVNVIGLARGIGRRISQILEYEKQIINEHDIAVVSLGNYKDCIDGYKWKIYNSLDIPVVVTGAPNKIDNDVCYIGGFGKVLHRLRSIDEIENLDKLVSLIENFLLKREEDYLVSSFAIKDEIEDQIDEIDKSTLPSPIVVQNRGLRVKLDYDKYLDKVKDVQIGKDRLIDIAEIKRSKIKNNIIVRPYPRYLLEVL